MIHSLNVAQTGLFASRLAVENVSNNIANQNTPGYKKRTNDLAEYAIIDKANVGSGVDHRGITRTTNEYMYNTYIRETSKENYYNKVSEMLGGIESVFKEYDNAGFSSDLDRYFQAVENLRTNPNSEIYKTDLATQGKIVVDSLNRLYSGIEAQEQYTKDVLDGDIREINSLLEEISAINVQLGEQPQATSDLLDKRDLLEFELSKYIDVEVTREPDYELRVAGQVALRYSINIRDVEVYENYTPQQDRFVLNDGKTSSILDGLDSGPTDFDDAHDKVTLHINNQHSVSVTYNEFVTDASGNNVDITGDGVVDASDRVNSSNYVRALTYTINHDAELSKIVTAYNGNYSLDENGNKVTNDNQDHFLLLEAKVDGPQGEFHSRIQVEEIAGTGDILNNSYNVYKDADQSNDSTAFYGISVFDEPIIPKSGSLKAVTDNLNTESGLNKFQAYKDKLDAFALTLSDLTDQYIRKGQDDYVYGESAIDNLGRGTVGLEIRDIGLFSGGSVKTLTFNEDAINDLSQTDLDYLSKLQWKQDVSFIGKGQDATDDDITSFSEFYQEVIVGVASDKENNDFLKDTQEAVTHNIQVSYEKIVKVDNDEEMINLMKFQAMYTANAKVITVVDEMLQTLLGIKR